MTQQHIESESASAIGNGSDSLRPRVRVAAIILRDSDILLVRHEKNDRSYWLLPGGGVEYSEALAEGLAREILEETGFMVEVGDLVLANDTIAPDGSRHTISLYFTAKIVDGTLRTGLDGVLVEAAFVPLSKVPELALYPDIRDALMETIQEGFPNKARYLGRVWREQQ